MDQRRFNQPTRHSKSVRRSYSSKNKLIFEVETYLVAYAKYRLEYYQTLINPKTKEVKDIDMDFKESE
jgi:hypothetical protein